MASPIRPSIIKRLRCAVLAWYPAGVQIGPEHGLFRTTQNGKA
jgi:hypothetical protein